MHQGELGRADDGIPPRSERVSASGDVVTAVAEVDEGGLELGRMGLLKVGPDLDEVEG